jgi:hypothetical protein
MFFWILASIFPILSYISVKSFVVVRFYDVGLLLNALILDYYIESDSKYEEG